MHNSAASIFFFLLYIVEVLVKGDNISSTRYAPPLFFSSNISHLLDLTYIYMYIYIFNVFKNWRGEIKQK